MILSAQTIRRLCQPPPFVKDRLPMVEPFAERSVHACGASFGLSSCGYDVRTKQDIFLWPLGSQLISTIERFAIPVDVVALVKDKSTWARRFVAVQNTVFEPGWAGWATIEVTNHSWRPVRIPAGAPIAQVMFLRLDEATLQPYQGKYNDQPDRPVPAILERPSS